MLDISSWKNNYLREGDCQGENAFPVFLNLGYFSASPQSTNSPFPMTCFGSIHLKFPSFHVDTSVIVALLRRLYLDSQDQNLLSQKKHLDLHIAVLHIYSQSVVAPCIAAFVPARPFCALCKKKRGDSRFRPSHIPPSASHRFPEQQSPAIARVVLV